MWSFIQSSFLLLNKVATKDSFDFDFMHTILFNSYALHVFFFGENMCEITYKTKEHAYLSIVHFHIEKRQNGVLNAKPLVYAHCNIIINPGIISIKELIKSNCRDIVIHSNKMNSYVTTNYSFYIVATFILQFCRLNFLSDLCTFMCNNLNAYENISICSTHFLWKFTAERDYNYSMLYFYFNFTLRARGDLCYIYNNACLSNNS